ncbi:MAG: regulatory protein RecX [Candidatus Gracilibacteria bacterium]
MDIPSYKKHLNYAMRALSVRAHSESEMRKKLQKREGIDSEIEEAVINRLKELNFLNDDLLINVALTNASNIYFDGHIKVASKLYKKGIPFAKTASIWKEMGMDEKEIAAKALARASKRFKDLPREKCFQKKARFLASKGFSPEIIFELASKGENM